MQGLRTRNLSNKRTYEAMSAHKEVTIEDTLKNGESAQERRYDN